MKYETDLEKIKKETRIDRLAASTRGGQRANRKETLIRLYHAPSGVRVKAGRERSQGRNLEQAFLKLQKKLEELNRPQKKRLKTRMPRAAKEKILKEKKRRSLKKESRQKVVP